MPFNKPVLLFDGDCGFCRHWILRWKSLSGDRILYMPSQQAGEEFVGIPPEEIQKSVQLIEPDGRRTSGAQAVFTVLDYAGHPGWLWSYKRIPGLAGLSEFAYSIVAGHRPVFSTLTRWLWGAKPAPPSYRMTRWLFLRALAVVYGMAFLSLAIQIKGLLGEEGIYQTRILIQQGWAYPSLARFWYLPTLAWFNSSDAFLVSLCWAGVLLSCLALMNVWPRLCFALLWVFYLSLVSIGREFLSFQWDALLLETGFLAMFFAPSGILPQRRGASSPPGPILMLLWWLLFRLMVQSALVKWLSGDTLWHHLTALTVHYQTQPIPNPVSWFVHQWPVLFHQISCALVLGIEGFVPILIFAPRRARHLAFWVLVGFQGLIFLTGNYAYFNCLTVCLCLTLLDDERLRSWLPAWGQEPILFGENRPWGIIIFGILFLTSVPFARTVGTPLPSWFILPAEIVSPLRSFNSYGLFAVMTPNRPEIILEGSSDGKVWKAYEFKYKPGNLARRPPQVAPYQPRLDWQMWFAALGNYQQNTWFINLCVRLLQGSRPVLDLLAINPFPDKPPTYIRTSLYEYRFTTPAERRQTGNWWAREPRGLYCPVLSSRRQA